MRRILMITAAIAGFAVAALTGLAIAKTAHNTLNTANNSTIGATIVVGGNGMTLYELRPETSQHLLCTSKPCLQAWPPLKVHSAKTKLHKAPGIKGKLGIKHRGGFFQVTLAGRPLYYFSGDSAKGQANGQGIVHFGGTWHVVKASSSSKGTNTPPASTTMPTMPSTTTNPYAY